MRTGFSEQAACRGAGFRQQVSDRRGFGTLDLLVTLTFVGIVLVISAPAARDAIGTYQRNGAARQVLSEIRRAQSLAVARGGVFGFQWGADPSVDRPDSEYRIVRDTTESCGFPAVDLPADGTNVIRAWHDLSSDFSGLRIESILDNGNQPLGGVMFDSRGISVNTCTTVSFPIEVVVSDPAGRTRSIEIRAAGGTRLL